MKRASLVFALVFTVMLLSINVFADNITDWTVTTGGAVSFNSAGGGPIQTVTPVPISSVTLITNGVPGTPVSINGGALLFSNPNNSTSSNGVLNWGAGGNLSITGCVSADGATCNPSTNVLLTDGFQSLTVQPVGSNFDVTFGEISGTIDSDLASSFGISSDFSASAFDLTFDPQGSYYETTSGNISADSVPATESWGLSTSLAFFALFGSILALLSRARVLRIVSAA